MGQGQRGCFYWEGFGSIEYAWGPKGLTQIQLIKQKKKGDTRYPPLENFLIEYQTGRWDRRLFPLDVSDYTTFQRQVWHVLASIPFGEVRSYQWIADQMGQPDAVRAVGQAVGANPFPILIPCHRVVSSDGSLGGFSCGLEWKRKLFKIEGIKQRGASFSTSSPSRKGGLGIG